MKKYILILAAFVIASTAMGANVNYPMSVSGPLDSLWTVRIYRPSATVLDSFRMKETSVGSGWIKTDTTIVLNSDLLYTFKYRWFWGAWRLNSAATRSQNTSEAITPISGYYASAKAITDSVSTKAAMVTAFLDADTTAHTAANTVGAALNASKVKTSYLPSVTAGASGGVFIAGSNAATSITTSLTVPHIIGFVDSVTGAGRVQTLDSNAIASNSFADATKHMIGLHADSGTSKTITANQNVNVAQWLGSTAPGATGSITVAHVSTLDTSAIASNSWSDAAKHMIAIHADSANIPLRTWNLPYNTSFTVGSMGDSANNNGFYGAAGGGGGIAAVDVWNVPMSTSFTAGSLGDSVKNGRGFNAAKAIHDSTTSAPSGFASWTAPLTSGQTTTAATSATPTVTVGSLGSLDFTSAMKTSLNNATPVASLSGDFSATMKTSLGTAITSNTTSANDVVRAIYLYKWDSTGVGADTTHTITTTGSVTLADALKKLYLRPAITVASIFNGTDIYDADTTTHPTYNSKMFKDLWNHTQPTLFASKSDLGHTIWTYPIDTGGGTTTANAGYHLYNVATGSSSSNWTNAQRDSVLNAILDASWAAKGWTKPATRVLTAGTNITAITIAADQAVNVTKLDGVALSTHAAGMIPADVRDWIGSTAPGSAGSMTVATATNVTNLGGVAAATALNNATPVVSIGSGGLSNASIASDARIGVDWNKISNPSATVSLVNTSVAPVTLTTGAYTTAGNAVWKIPRDTSNSHTGMFGYNVDAQISLAGGTSGGWSSAEKDSMLAGLWRQNGTGANIWSNNIGFDFGNIINKTATNAFTNTTFNIPSTTQMTLAATQGQYAPAKAGDQMALTMAAIKLVADTNWAGNHLTNRALLGTQTVTIPEVVKLDSIKTPDSTVTFPRYFNQTSIQAGTGHVTATNDGGTGGSCSFGDTLAMLLQNQGTLRDSVHVVNSLIQSYHLATRDTLHKIDSAVTNGLVGLTGNWLKNDDSLKIRAWVLNALQVDYDLPGTIGGNIGNVDAPVSSIEGPAGNGAFTRNVVVVDTSTHPNMTIYHAQVSVNNSAETLNKPPLYTNNLGTVTFNLDAGQWKYIVTAAGYADTRKTVTTSGAGTDTVKIYWSAGGRTPISWYVSKPTGWGWASPKISIQLVSVHDSLLHVGDTLITANYGMTVDTTGSYAGYVTIPLYPNSAFTNDSTYYKVTERDSRNNLLIATYKFRVPASDTAISVTSLTKWK